MKYEKINPSLFIGNRKRFTEQIPAGALALFNSNDIMPTNADGVMPFRQNNDLFYLSGVDQEESILILFPSCSTNAYQEILFVKETNEQIAIWEGAKLTQKQATEVSGIKTVYWLDQFEAVLEQILKEGKTIYLNKNTHDRSVNKVETRDDRFRKWIQEKYSKKNYEEVAPIMHQLRTIKSDIEIQLMQKACNITEKAFRRTLDFIKPGLKEYEIEAEVIHEFIKNGATGHAYQPIIASGFNACVLHYIDNNQVCKDGQLILMDFGAEYANYSSDLTRTVPANGRYTDRQKAVYNIVLKAHREAILMMTVGNNLKDLHAEVGKIIESGLVDLGILDKTDIKNQDPQKPLYTNYFMHGTSHLLGLDTHDVGDRFQTFKEGMVFTVEPGIYIRKERLGIRIENDIVITKDGPLDLMKAIPITIEEIEELMN